METYLLALPAHQEQLDVDAKPTLVVPESVDFTKFIYVKKYLRMETQLQLFFDFDLKDITIKNTKVFDDYTSLLHYSLKNPDKQIYLTRTQVVDFCEEENKIV